MGTNTSIYIGTESGLFRGRLGERIEDVELLGLSGYGRVWPVVVDVKDTRRMYVATNRGGIWRSQDEGKTWKEINEGLIYKEAWCLVQHPDTGELFAGTGPASVFRSCDYGDTWTHCEHLHTLPESEEWTFPKAPFIAHVKGLGLVQRNPDVVFGAVEEGWLIRSTDRGKTWTNLKQGTEFDSHTVVPMPDDPRVVVSTSGTGCYRSEDGGDTFKPSNEGLTRRYMAHLVMHPAEPQVMFSAAAAVPVAFWRRPQGADTAFFRSDDQGRTWSRLSGGLPEHFSPGWRATAGDPQMPGSFFVGMSDGAIWCTRNHGETFQQIAGGLPPAYGITVVHQ